jgi:hypothetical protein
MADDMSEQNPKLDPARAAGAFLVVECDVPAEMTLGEWRRHCAAEQRDANAAAGRRGLLRRALRRAA